MAKKRKVRPSEPESSTKPPEETQPQQQEEEEEPQQIEEEQEQEQYNEEEEEDEEEQDPQTIMEEDDQKEETLNEESNGKDEKQEEEEELEDEPVEKLLEPFSKEQLFLLLKDAVSKYPDFVQNVQKLADADPAHRKIFVHGMGWDSNTDTLTTEFSQYGQIEDCKVVCDKVSGKSKGYGFILFKHRAGAQKALKEPQKKIGNRMTSCQLASAGPVPAPPPVGPPVSEYTQRKIFVSNVSVDIDPQKLLDFFAKFGEIEDGPLGLDKQTGKPKGFALFVYKTIDSAKKALEEPHKNFEGHILHCQRAIDGPKPNKPYYQQQHHHHYPSKKGKYSGGGSGHGHLMAPSGPPAGGFNPAVTPSALTPALGQALTALLASQGAGFGITNLLGASQGVQPAMNNAGYGNQGGGGAGGYGGHPQAGYQGGYQNPQAGYQGGASSRPQQGSASYMGHGH